LGCPWEELTAFPTLDAALNSDGEGALLTDIVAVLGTDNIGVVLRATGFEVDEVQRVVHLYVPGVMHIAQRKLHYVEENPSSNATSSISNYVTPCSELSRDVQHESLPQNLK
jgi:hypothetical protein